MDELRSVRRILCPVDGAGGSRRAILHALALARRRQAAVNVLYVLTAPELAGVTAGSRPRGLDLEEERADVRRLVRPGAAHQVPFELQVEHGDPAEETAREAQATRADLVVLDARGWAEAGTAGPAAMARGILQQAGTPVLVVTAHSARAPMDSGFERIVCSVDLSPGSGPVVEQAASLARESPPARLTLLHVLEGFPHQEVEAGQAGDDLGLYWRYRQVQAEEALAELAAARGGACRTELLVASGKPWLETLDVASEREADLIVVGSHGAGPGPRGTADLLIDQAACPVLVVPSG